MLIPTINDIIVIPTHEIFARFGGAGLVVDSTATIELTLPTPDTNTLTHRAYPHVNLDAEALIARIEEFRISCSSDNFDLWLFSKDGDPETLKDTIYQIHSSTGIDKRYSLSDSGISNLPIFMRNYNSPVDGKYYLYIENNGISSGEISIEMMYMTLLSNRDN